LHITNINVPKKISIMLVIARIFFKTFPLNRLITEGHKHF